MSKDILVISNMYPSTKFPSFGVFVKVIVDEIKRNNDVKKIVMNKSLSSYSKALRYVAFYFRQLSFLFYNSPNNIYCHFISHTIFIPVFYKLLGKNFHLIAHVHGSDIFYKNKVLEFVICRLVKHVDKIIVPSETYRDLVSTNFSFPYEKIIVSASGGVSGEFFNNNTPRKSDNEYTYDLSFVGRLSLEKNPMSFVSKLSELSERNLVMNSLIVGAGPMYEQVVQKLALCKCNTSLVPLVEKTELIQYFDSTKYLLVTSSRESLCLVALEAMARGVVVISSKSGGPESYIEHAVNGFLYDESNENSVSEIGEYLSISESEYEIISNRARETALKYKTETVLKNVNSFFI